MLAVVKTPHTKIRIEGRISSNILSVLRKEYGPKLHLEQDNSESVNYFETDFAKKMDKLSSPADCVKIYRQNKGWTQGELGEKVGVSKNYISDWENGHREISKEKAKSLSKLFNISADYFI